MKRNTPSVSNKLKSENRKPQLLRVLMVEDSEDDALLIIRELKKGGYNPVYERVETAAAMKKALKEKQWDIILCDYNLPKFNAPSAIAVLKEANIDIPIIIVSGTIGEDVAIECMRLGAQDYIMKGNLSRLCPAIDRELEEAEVRNKQKQAEEDLRENEERFRRISSLTSDIAYSCRTNEDGRFSIGWMIGATEHISGYSIEEIKAQMCWRFLVIDEDLALFEKNVIGLVPGSQGFCELHIRHKNGGIVPIVSYAECFMDTETPEHFILYGALVDVTESRKAEEALQEGEERYRTIFENTGTSMILIEEDMTISMSNGEFVRNTGYSPDEINGRMKWTEIIHPDDLDRMIEQHRLRRESQGGALPSYEFRYITKKGDLRDTLLNIKLVPGTKKSIASLIDITERKKFDETLKNSELKYRNIFENAIEGIYQSTIEGRFITANAALARMAGYDSPEELIESVKDIETQLYVHSEDRKRFMEIMEAKGFVEGFEVEFYKKDGSKFWIVINARSVKDEQGKILCIEGLAEDITIRKHAEEQLQQTLEQSQKSCWHDHSGHGVRCGGQRSLYGRSSDQVCGLARAIATEMGLSQDKIEGIRMAGSIHDIGKLSIPAEILSKPTKLTDIEFSLIKEHSQNGYEMLKDVESPWPLAEIVYQHHERMNGSGYPRNLKGDEILMEARILAVADVVEAMASHRPYRPGLGIEAALEEIEKNKGILYDNTVADACLRLFREKGYQLHK